MTLTAEEIWNRWFRDKYTPTWSNTLEHFLEGYAVYTLMCKGFSRRDATISVRGYRYRRLEEYVSEVGLAWYDPRVHRWRPVFNYWEVCYYYKYTSKKPAWSRHLEVRVLFMFPLHFEARDVLELVESELSYVFYDLAVSVGFAPELLDASQKKGVCVETLKKGAELVREVDRIPEGYEYVFTDDALEYETEGVVIDVERGYEWSGRAYAEVRYEWI